MTKTKSILIIVFALICVAVGLMSPYMLAGVNEQDIKNNQVNVVSPEYDEMNFGETYQLSIEKNYGYFYFPRAYMENNTYVLSNLICDDNGTYHDGWSISSSVIKPSQNLTYNFICTNNNGEIVTIETKHIDFSFIVNSFESVNLLVETYTYNNELILSKTINDLSYNDTFYDDGSVKTRVFEYSLNLENLDTFKVILELYNLENSNFDGHIHNN